MYEMIENPQPGELVQYLGVYVLRWQPEWGTPQVAFREVPDQSETIADLLAALEAVINSLRTGQCAGIQMPVEFWAAYDQAKIALARAKGGG